MLIQGNPQVVVHAMRGHADATLRAAFIIERLPFGPVSGAEVGVFTGRVSKALLGYPSLKLFMVDSWEGDGAAYESGNDWHADLTQEQQDHYARVAEANTAFAHERRVILRQRSLDAAKAIEDKSLDFVFLDADHSEAGLTADITAWLPKIKSGGILCGHDYGNPLFPDVKAVASRVFGVVESDEALMMWAVRC